MQCRLWAGHSYLPRPECAAGCGHGAGTARERPRWWACGRCRGGRRHRRVVVRLCKQRLRTASAHGRMSQDVRELPAGKTVDIVLVEARCSVSLLMLERINARCIHPWKYSVIIMHLHGTGSRGSVANAGSLEYCAAAIYTTTLFMLNLALP